MASDWELKRREMQQAAEATLAALIEHMGPLDSFQFALNDGRLITVKMGKEIKSP